MLEADELHAAIVAFRQPKVLAGKRVLLTAGPTFEPIDPVRGITNSSSGKMGFALAQAAAEAGADVTVVAGPSAVGTPPNVTRVDVQSAAQMADAVLQRVDDADVFIGVAAVADYAPDASSDRKLKKSNRADDAHAQADGRHSRHGGGRARTRRSASASPRRATMSSSSPRKSAAARSCRCSSQIVRRTRSATMRTRSRCSTTPARYPLPKMDKLALARQAGRRDREAPEDVRP